MKQTINIVWTNVKKNDVENLKDPKAFIEYSHNLQGVYQHIEECIWSRKCKVLILFDDMTVDVISNKKT